MPFGDNFDLSVDHTDGGLIINCIRRPLHPGGPSFCISHCIMRQHLVIQMREHCKIDKPQRFITTVGWIPANEEVPDVRCHYHTPSTHSHIDCVERRQEVCKPGLPHPMAQVEGVAARHQQDVRLPDQRHPAVFVDAWQRCKLQHSNGFPAQVYHGILFFPADELPGFDAGADPGVSVHRGGDAQGVGVGDWLAQHVNQRVMYAFVNDTRRCKQ